MRRAAVAVRCKERVLTAETLAAALAVPVRGGEEEAEGQGVAVEVCEAVRLGCAGEGVRVGCAAAEPVLLLQGLGVAVALGRVLSLGRRDSVPVVEGEGEGVLLAASLLAVPGEEGLEVKVGDASAEAVGVGMALGVEVALLQEVGKVLVVAIPDTLAGGVEEAQGEGTAVPVPGHTVAEVVGEESVERVSLDWVLALPAAVAVLRAVKEASAVALLLLLDWAVETALPEARAEVLGEPPVPLAAVLAGPLSVGRPEAECCRQAVDVALLQGDMECRPEGRAVSVTPMAEAVPSTLLCEGDPEAEGQEEGLRVATGEDEMVGVEALEALFAPPGLPVFSHAEADTVAQGALDAVQAGEVLGEGEAEAGAVAVREGASPVAVAQAEPGVPRLLTEALPEFMPLTVALPLVPCKESVG